MMAIPLTQIVLIALVVRKRRTCKVGWTEAGTIRRTATLAWMLACLLANASLRREEGKPDVAVEDIFPMGMDSVQRQDIQQAQSEIGEWLDVWCDKNPDRTIKSAASVLVASLAHAKHDWGRNLPFDIILSGLSSDQENCQQAWTNAGVQRRRTTLVWAMTKAAMLLGVENSKDMAVALRLEPEYVDQSAIDDEAVFTAERGLLEAWLSHYGREYPTNTISDAIEEFAKDITGLKPKTATSAPVRFAGTTSTPTR